MNKIIALSLSSLFLSSLAFAASPKPAIKAELRKDYAALMNTTPSQLFNQKSLHNYAIGMSLKGNQYKGTFTSYVAARNGNMGAGIPTISGNYKKAGSKFKVTINPTDLP